MNKILGGVLVLAAVAVSVDRVMDSYHRSTVGVSEINDVRKISEATGEEKDVSGIATSSELGNQMKDFIAKVQKLEAKFNADIEKTPLDSSLEWERIATKAGRKQSRKELDDYYRCYEAYIHDLAKLRRGFSAQIKEKSLTAKTEDQIAVEQKMLKARKTLHDYYEDMFQILDASKIEKVDGEWVFMRETEFDKYAKAEKRAIAAEETIERMADKFLKDMEERQQNARNRLATARP